MIDFVYKESQCNINEKQLKTKLKTFELNRIEKVGIKYNFFFLFPTAVFLLLFTWKFSLFLYGYEEVILVFLSVLFIFISFYFGVIEIQSRTVKESALLGPIGVLKKIRLTLDENIQNGNLYEE